MALLCKFEVLSVSKHEGCRAIEFVPVGYNGIRPPVNENRVFWDATPSGKLEMSITNPDAFASIDSMNPGDDYYIEIRKARK